MSLDGDVAGPAQSREDPVGVRDLELHEWHWHAGEPGHAAIDVPTSSPQASTPHRSRRVPSPATRSWPSPAGPRRCSRRWLRVRSTSSSSTWVTVLLRRGERLFDGVADPGLEPVDVVHSPHATHVRYRIGR
jgi:hypothetical protein